MDFQNKVVLIIGGSAGIGAATAVAFASHGANVVIVGRRESKLEEIATLCEKSGKRAVIVKADITIDEEAAAAVTKTIEKFGNLDVLINSAGILRQGTIIDGKAMENFDEVFNTNVRSFMYITTLAAPYLIRSKGNIVNISSIVGDGTLKIYIPLTYSMSKAAVNIFTKGAAYEFASHGVRVNAVSPGPTNTEMFDDVKDFVVHKGYKTDVPLNRISESSEIADLILFLASEKAKGITGSNYVIDNGCSLVS